MSHDQIEKLVDERNELFAALVDMVGQHCVERDGTLESSFLTSDAEAIRLLCRLGALDLVHDGFGRVVTAKWKAGGTYSMATFQSSHDWADLVNNKLLEIQAEGESR